MRVLVEDGKADISVKDRWGATPLDEAIRVGAKPVAMYLTSLNAGVGKETDRIMEFLYASSTGDVETIRHVSPALTPALIHGCVVFGSATSERGDGNGEAVMFIVFICIYSSSRVPNPRRVAERVQLRVAERMQRSASLCRTLVETL